MFSHFLSSRLAKLIHQRGRELKKEVDEAIEKLEGQLGVRSPNATLQFVPSEFSLRLDQFGHILEQVEPTATTTSTFGEVALSLFIIWSLNHSYTLFQVPEEAFQLSDDEVDLNPRRKEPDIPKTEMTLATELTETTTVEEVRLSWFCPRIIV